MADKETDYKEASFFLHQSCENYYYAIRLTHTLRNSKQHNLSKLISPHFVVTKEDIDALIPKVEMLRDITMRICEEKIKVYGNTD